MEIDIGQAGRIRGNGSSSNTRNVSGWMTHPWVSEGIGALRFGVQVWPMPADWPKVIDLAHLQRSLGSIHSGSATIRPAAAIAGLPWRHWR